MKKNDPDDISLLNGRGYFVEDEPFRKYVEDHANDVEEVSLVHSYRRKRWLIRLRLPCRKALVRISMRCKTTTILNTTSNVAVVLLWESVATV